MELYTIYHWSVISTLLLFNNHSLYRDKHKPILLVSGNNWMQSRGESKADLVSNWRQKFSRHYVAPEETQEPTRHVVASVKRKKAPSTDNKVPVINLLSKLAGDGVGSWSLSRIVMFRFHDEIFVWLIYYTANYTRRPSFDDKLDAATHLSLLVPEDKLKPRDDGTVRILWHNGYDLS